MADTDKSRFVATALGLPICKGCFFTPHESKRAVREARWENGAYRHVDHPPDFLEPAGADLLLRTLLAQPQKYGVDFYRNGRGVCVCRINDIPGYGATWLEALLDAAFKALEEK